MSVTHGYRVVNPDWTSPRDVVALEHFGPGFCCLVFSTTLGLSLQDAIDAATEHSFSCEQPAPESPVNTLSPAADAAVAELTAANKQVKVAYARMKEAQKNALAVLLRDKHRSLPPEMRPRT